MLNGTVELPPVQAHALGCHSCQMQAHLDSEVTVLCPVPHTGIHDPLLTQSYKTQLLFHLMSCYSHHDIFMAITVPPSALTFMPSVPKTFHIRHSFQLIFYFLSCTRLSLEILLCWLRFQFSWSLHDLPHRTLSSCHHFPQMQDLWSSLQTQPCRNWYKDFPVFSFFTNRAPSIYTTLREIHSCVTFWAYNVPEFQRL